MNPVLLEAWRGLGGHGSAQRTWLICLGCLAVVLVIWWPQREVLVALTVQRGPNTALALVTGIGIASAWWALAMGTEELRIQGQQTLHQWREDGELGATRIVFGLVLAQGLQTLHAFVLATPLLVAAVVVSPTTSAGLGGCLLGAALQSLWCRLAGANIKLALGRHPELCSAAVRGLFVAALAIPPFLAPIASHLMVAHALLRDDSNAAAGFAGLSVVESHLLFGALTLALLSAVLYWQLRRRQSQEAAAID